MGQVRMEFISTSFQTGHTLSLNFLCGTTNLLFCCLLHVYNMRLYLSYLQTLFYTVCYNVGTLLQREKVYACRAKLI
jgi:hypothetical protein